MSAAELTLIFGAAGAIATIIAAIVAVLALQAARTDSRDRSRPMIVPEIRKEPLSKSTINLVVRNVGASPARNVHVTFPAKVDVVPSSLPTGDVWRWILERYARPIHVWSQGWELSNTVKFGPDDPLKAFEVEVTYDAVSDGPNRKTPRYRDRFELDPEWISNNSQAGPSDSSASGVEWWRDWTKRGVRATEIIARALFRG